MSDTELSEEEKWKTLIDCNFKYDGRFSYVVRTTGIFCLPSYKSKSPKRENVVFFDKLEQVKERGLRHCKRCRPDLLEYQSIKSEF